MFSYCACSDKGSERKNNEDRIIVDNNLLSAGNIAGTRKNELLAVVCDGVGGTDNGELAAEMISSSFRDFKIAETSPLSLSQHLHKVNRKVTTEQETASVRFNMASTVAGMMFYKNRYLLFNLGDTRIYQFSGSKLLQISKDHTANSEVQTAGITRYIGGTGNACRPFIKTGKIISGGYYMICSDGIYKGLDDECLVSIFSTDSSLEEKRRAILKLALKNGSTDDKSVILIKCAA